jgi:glutaredoxin 3
MNKALLHAIVIYTLANCSYCIKAKKLLEEKQVVYEEIAVDHFKPEQREELAKKARGKRTVPQIFIGSIHIGGYDKLLELEQEGRLDKLLEGQPKKGRPVALSGAKAGA